MWAGDVVAQRSHAVELVKDGVSVSEAARVTGVTRQCVHKWVARERAEGASGLLDRSRAPLEHPNAVSKSMKRRILKLQRKHREGAVAIRHYLVSNRAVKERVPAASTIGGILKDNGRVVARRKVRYESAPSHLTTPENSNDVWSIDFKGDFEVGRTRCYPLTITDCFSRTALCVRAQLGTGFKPTKDNAWRVFRTYGLPRVIRSDNGNPFVSVRAPNGLTRFMALLIKLDIEIERIEPGRPDQNGIHERFHKTLKRRTAAPPAKSWAAQQKRFDRFRRHYNHDRPHSSLEMKTPLEVYQPSQRCCPSSVPPIEHPSAQRILAVYEDGGVSFNGLSFHLTSAIAQETVGVTEIEDDIYQLSYGPIYIGTLNFRFKDPRVQLLR